LIVTKGAPREIEELLEPHRSELELEIHPADRTTTLQSAGGGDRRTQRMLAWAGTIDENITIDTSILHLAPVARETRRRWLGRADFVGLTPQGLVRAWAQGGGKISLVPLSPAQLPERCDAVVISETERRSCAWLTAPAGGATSRRARPAGSVRPTETTGTLVAVTAAAAPTAIHLPDGAIAHVEVPAIENFRDDVGAGDVFAAAFFVALREGRSAPAAAAFANAAAAVRIAGDGAESIGDRSAIEARLRAVTGA
jgi:sugar/nucleoside kinase (ribokinase family)